MNFKPGDKVVHTGATWKTGRAGIVVYTAYEGRLKTKESYRHEGIQLGVRFYDYDYGTEDNCHSLYKGEFRLMTPLEEAML